MKAARIFQDHMVLQRGKEVQVWGTGTEGEQITVSFFGHSRSAAVEHGGWRVTLPPMEAHRGGVMTISGPEGSVELQNVAVGEVWLAGGQSNMEFQMLFDMHYEEELAACECPDIRFFDYPEVSYDGQEEDFDYSRMGFWRPCGPEHLKYFSAVAYYTAKMLYEEMDVPIGIVGCNWGGTTASCWMDEDSLKKHGQVWIEDYENGLKRIPDLERYKAEFRKDPANSRGLPFDDAFTMLVMPGLTKEAQLELASTLPKGDARPAAGPYSPNRPCALYHSMLTHTAPYTIRGVLWYQGESDDPHYDIYQDVLQDLIECWRALWKEELPFLLVQLAPMESFLGTEWPHFSDIREAQAKCAGTLPQVWLASASDVGMRYDIHPKDKKPIGERLALLAQGHVYGQELLCDAPEFDRAERTGNRVRIHFRNAGGGLVVKGDSVHENLFLVNGMEIDPKKVRAEESRVDLELETSAPCRIAFAKRGYYEVNLYNSAGLPALPFETEV